MTKLFRQGLAALLLTALLVLAVWHRRPTRHKARARSRRAASCSPRITPISSPAGKAPASRERTDALAEDPQMVVLWAGYPFSKDYNKAARPLLCADRRAGNPAYRRPKTAEDGPLPMACWSCKGPDVARVIDEKGEDGYFKGHVGKGGPEDRQHHRLRRLPRHRLERVQGRATRLHLSRPYADRARPPSASRSRSRGASISSLRCAASATWSTTSAAPPRR